jgi:hypothetical protein
MTRGARTVLRADRVRPAACAQEWLRAFQSCRLCAGGFELEHHDNTVAPLVSNEPGYVLDFDVLLDRVVTACFGVPVGRELTVTASTDHPMASVNHGKRTHPGAVSVRAMWVARASAAGTPLASPFSKSMSVTAIVFVM